MTQTWFAPDTFAFLLKFVLINHKFSNIRKDNGDIFDSSWRFSTKQKSVYKFPKQNVKVSKLDDALDSFGSNILLDLCALFPK